VGPVPLLPRYCEALRLLTARPAALRCLRLAVPRVRRWLRSRRRTAHRQRAWVLVLGPPTDDLARRRSGLPGSWGTPMRTCPALRPRRDLGTRPPRCLDVAFRAVNGVGSRSVPSHGAPSHGLHAPCVRFAGRITPPPRNTRFRRVANPCRAGVVTRWVPAKGFRPSRVVHCHPPFPGLPGALVGSPGRLLARAPSDPDVRDSRIRLFKAEVSRPGGRRCGSRREAEAGTSTAGA
jgi:hypothetical protein